LYTKEQSTGQPAHHTAAPPTPVPPDRRPRTSPGALRLLRDLLALARPGQWPKNLLVVPLALLAAPVWTAGEARRAAWAVAVFTLFSAAAYALNDVADRHRDRAHPVKCRRPVAAGRLSPRTAVAYAALLCVTGALLLSLLPLARWWPVPVYLAVTTVYSAGLKNVPLLDVFLVATGFLLRVEEGYLATGVPQSTWLPTSVFCLCLLLALGKRRHELAESGDQFRPALRGYSLSLLDQLTALSGMLAAAAFLLFLHSEAPLAPHADAAGLACLPLVLLGLFRYLQVVTAQQGGGDPVRALLGDRVLVADALVLGAVLVAALAAAHHSGLAPVTAPLLFKAV
jgi:decaprenyl-phosphate phosphoribosyltransferase